MSRYIYISEEYYGSEGVHVLISNYYGQANFLADVFAAAVLPGRGWKKLKQRECVTKKLVASKILASNQRYTRSFSQRQKIGWAVLGYHPNGPYDTVHRVRPTRRKGASGGGSSGAKGLFG
jgi:hypothetical protein